MKRTLFVLLFCNILSLNFVFNSEKFLTLFFFIYLSSGIYFFCLNYLLITKKNSFKAQRLTFYQLSFIYLITFIMYLPSTYTVIIPMYLTFLILWDNFIKKINSFINLKSSFIYRNKLIYNNGYNNFFYNLLEYRYRQLNKINFLFLPISLIIFVINICLYHFPNLFLLIIVIFIIFCFLIEFYRTKIKNKILFTKDNSNEIIYNIIKKYSPEFILYFSGNSKSTFQINSWLPLLKKSGHKFIILLRETHHFHQFIDTDIPSIYIKDTIGVEKIASLNSVRAAFYTTNVGKNIHLLRDTNIKHIFLGHGDSDKSSSANNLFKIYDYIFVAGQAHIDRLNKNNLKIPVKNLFKIGRPQLEILKYKKENNKFNILYAPTWEGFYADSSYSSLGILNEKIKNLINDNIEFNFKAHPLTSSINSKYLKFKDEMNALSSQQHDILYKYFYDADVLISDISAILSDFLYFNKPIILYKPEFINDIKNECPISECCYIIDNNTNLKKLLKEIKANDYLLEKRKAMKTYIMGESNNSQRFFEALKQCTS